MYICYWLVDGQSSWRPTWLGGGTSISPSTEDEQKHDGVEEGDADGSADAQRSSGGSSWFAGWSSSNAEEPPAEAVVDAAQDDAGSGALAAMMGTITGFWGSSSPQAESSEKPTKAQNL